MSIFDKDLDRWHTRSEKWDGMLEKFGTSDLIPLWEADMDCKCSPQIIDHFRKRVEHGVFGYTIRDDAFFNAIINWQARRNNWQIEKEWIRNAPGTIPALSAAILAFTEPGDEIIIQEPVYYRFFNSIILNERKTLHNTMIFDGDQYLLDFEGLENMITERTKMIVICNPQNPVGKVFTKEELLRIGEICLKHNILIVSDELYSDILFDGRKHYPIASLSEALKMNTITMFGPGKGFNLPGLKASIVTIANPELMKIYDRTADAIELFMKNLFSIEGVIAAYEYSEEWLDEITVLLQEKRDYVVDYIRTNIPEINIVKPEGTYIAWLDMRFLNMSDAELEAFLVNEAKIGVKYGHTFGKGGSGFIRINFASSKTLLEEALERLADAVKKQLAK
ncbi:MalY/PatB family protein [Fusibacter tunisiensis]|uniref:cysteine-S-conjugate beta-lyase n=1 Tax=Fusibacter tunisiensis TaxID=1008308 RepID=A0ABS2MTQ5_9FIRM|nr:MalY/PatB family protein [Fusibacter tunisiensis]MBM7562792.1 cystathionine beta-lyase [Fusibacter tunisiensis]